MLFYAWVTQMGDFQGTTTPELLSDEKDLQVFSSRPSLVCHKWKINIYDLNFLIERDLETISQVK